MGVNDFERGVIKDGQSLGKESVLDDYRVEVPAFQYPPECPVASVHIPGIDMHRPRIWRLGSNDGAFQFLEKHDNSGFRVIRDPEEPFYPHSCFIAASSPNSRCI